MSRTTIKYYTIAILLGLALHAFPQSNDSAAVLKKVTVSAVKKKNTFTAITPTQSLDRQTLQQINAQSVGDAARYFSGVLIKDYGGVGGLKTISVRSLGAAHTGVNYDGIPVSDAQSGQIDLSKYSSTFAQSLDLQQANAPWMPQPARAYSYGALLSIQTQSFTNNALEKSAWQGGIKTGSFGLWQPFAGIHLVLPKKIAVSLNTEAVFSKGDYPYHIDNGSFSQNARRDNSDVKSLQGEINLLKMFTDSSSLQVKLGGYHSGRGLPGALVFFNDRSVQRLWNTDYYLQGRYQLPISTTSRLLLSAKISHSYTRYTDPDYLNNQGGIDNRYTQQEAYLSAAISHNIGNHLTAAASSDVSFSQLDASLASFARPTRRGLWNNLAVSYSRRGWQLSASALFTSITDHTKTASAAGTINKLTPTLAVNVKPATESPFLFRVFYKHVFRMPTFNDLYYNLIGSTSLRPEYARQYNAGIVYSITPGTLLKHFSISADGYYNTVKDKIIAVPNKNLFVWTMLNLGRVDITGIDMTTEAGGALTREINWFARIAYTWQQALDVTTPGSTTYKNRIPYTPDHSGSGLVSFYYRRWSAGYSLIFSATRYTLGENNPYNQLPGWGTQDAFISRRFTLKTISVNIRAGVDNITDHRYDVVRYFPMPGRSYKISLLLNNL